MEKNRKWSRFRYMPCLPLGKDGRRVTASKAHTALARRAAAEGMVLLKNAGLLPLARGSRVAVFGKGQADYVKGGGGSGDVTVPYEVSLLDALLEKEASGALELCAPVSRFYRDSVAAQRAAGATPGKAEEPALPETLLEEAAGWTDTALVVLSRYSREEIDHRVVPGDFLLSREEAALLETVFRRFPRSVVVLNTGGAIDFSLFAQQAGAVLFMGQAGMEGGHAAADILCGDCCPCGKLADTFAWRYEAYPTAMNFDRAVDYTAYEEDIYVGYRYFETIPGAAEDVCWPFGYGLSYTTFALGEAAMTEADGTCTAVLQVKNTGPVPGREVVQIYCEPPRGKLDKPGRVLCAFQKTPELAPGEAVRLTLRFPISACASYDDAGVLQKSAWLLEGGVYRFHIGTSVRDTVQADFQYTVQAPFAVLAQLSARCVPKKLKRRLCAEGHYVPVAAEKSDMPESPAKQLEGPEVFGVPEPCPWQAPLSGPPGKSLEAVAEGQYSLDDFLAGLSDSQLVHLLGGQPNQGVANTFGIGNLPLYGVPNIMTADGPAGLRIELGVGVETTAFHCATILACTWDEALVEAVGAAGGLEVRENGIGIWLTPAINIHRDPLCGRNFEYYSEDPLLTGRLAAAMVRGIQGSGVAATVKHFAVNNREENRKECDSRVSERALREIYLRGFQLCIQEAQPWLVMSSYNRLNGVRTSENRELLTGILRQEWGYAGAVTTDWWNWAEHWREVKAGNDVRMPVGEPAALLAALEDGRLSRAEVLDCARRVLTLILKLAAEPAER